MPGAAARVARSRSRLAFPFSPRAPPPSLLLCAHAHVDTPTSICPRIPDSDPIFQAVGHSLPESIGNLTLDSLIISHNALRGTIPKTIGNINARLLYLDDNQFTGTLPSSLANSHLQGIIFDLNKLTGTIPSQFGSIGSQLMLINGAFNNFVGTLPSGVCKANACNFQYNAHLGCPSQSACGKCALPLCNCGKVCYSANDCAGGSCSGCSSNSWGVKTCGGK